MFTLRCAGRSLRRHPTFTILAVTALSIGIGANVCVFTLVNSVVFRDLPFSNSRRLAVLREVLPRVRESFDSLPANALHFHLWKERATAFDSLAAIGVHRVAVQVHGAARELNVATVTTNWFQTLGVRPVLGRDFADRDAVDPSVAILSFALWRDVFDADTHIDRRGIELDGRSYQIIAVMPHVFDVFRRDALAPPLSYGDSVDVFTPMTFDAARLRPNGPYDFGVVGLLKAGTTLRTAETELQTIQRTIEAETVGAGRLNLGARVVGLQDHLFRGVRGPVLFLWIAVVILQLLTLLDVGGLVLLRTVTRTRELRIRWALGATEAAVVRVLLVEIAVICIIGSVIGAMLAMLSTKLLASFEVFSHLPIPWFDWRVVLMFFIVSGTSIGAIGSVAAMIAPSAGAVARVAGARGLASAMRWAIAVESALAVVLLIVSVTTVSGFLSRAESSQGFVERGAVAATISLPQPRYAHVEDRNRFFATVLARVSGYADVKAAGMTSMLPLAGDTFVDMAKPDDSELGEPVRVNYRLVTAGFHRAMEIGLQRGQLLVDDEDLNVAVVSRTLADRVWPGQDPIGRQFSRGSKQLWRVIGIVDDVPTSSIDNVRTPTAYISYRNRTPLEASFVVRSALDTESALRHLQTAIHQTDSSVPIGRLSPLSSLREDALAPHRLLAEIAAAFSVAASILITVAIYGVTAFSFASQRRNTTIRLALGAPPWHLYVRVCAAVLAPVAIGLGAGTGVFALGAWPLLRMSVTAVNRPSAAAVFISVVCLATIAILSACAGARDRISLPLIALLQEDVQP